MATLPTGNQELLVVTDKVRRHPGELGVYKSMGWDIFPFSALTQSWFGRQEEHPACKETGCWFVGGGDLTGGWSFARLIAPVVQLSPPRPSSFASNKHRLTQVHLENGR